MDAVAAQEGVGRGGGEEAVITFAADVFPELVCVIEEDLFVSSNSARCYEAKKGGRDGVGRCFVLLRDASKALYKRRIRGALGIGSDAIMIDSGHVGVGEAEKAPISSIGELGGKINCGVTREAAPRPAAGVAIKITHVVANDVAAGEGAFGKHACGARHFRGRAYLNVLSGVVVEGGIEVGGTSEEMVFIIIMKRLDARSERVCLAGSAGVECVELSSVGGLVAGSGGLFRQEAVVGALQRCSLLRSEGL
jgi:hypothetical protein